MRWWFCATLIAYRNAWRILFLFITPSNAIHDESEMEIKNLTTISMNVNNYFSQISYECSINVLTDNAIYRAVKNLTATQSIWYVKGLHTSCICFFTEILCLCSVIVCHPYFNVAVRMHVFYCELKKVKYSDLVRKYVD